MSLLTLFSQPSGGSTSTITISENTTANFSGLFATSSVEQGATDNYYTVSGRFGRSGEIQRFQPTDRCNAFLNATGISNIPTGVKVTNAVLRVYFYEVSGNFTIDVHQQLRDAVMSELTWIRYSVGNDFQTPGGYGALDRNATVIANASMVNGQSAGYVDFTGSGLTQFVQDCVDGVITLPNLMMDTDTADFTYSFFRNSLFTDGFRPELVVTYETAGSALLINDSTHAHSADNVNFSIGTQLFTNNTLHSHASDNVTLNTNQFLIVNESNHSHSADNLVLVSNNGLTVNDSTHGHNADNTILTSATGLTLADSAHAHSVENLTLDTTAAINLIIADSSHNNTTYNITFTLQSNIAVNDSNHAHAIDNLLLASSTGLSINEALHAHSVDNIALTGSTTLTANDSLHNHNTENISLTVTGQTNLVVAESTHLHNVDGLVLSSNTNITVNESTHNHFTDNILFSFAISLNPIEATHAQFSDNLTFSTNSFLALNKASHLQFSDNIQLVDNSLIQYGNIDYYIATGRELMHIVGNRAYNYTSTARNYTHEA